MDLNKLKIEHSELVIKSKMITSRVNELEKILAQSFIDQQKVEASNNKD